MDDDMAFEHGSEGTHMACQRRLDKEGGKATCCICNPHEDCNFGSGNTTSSPTESVKEK